ncbi:peptide chain release factor N(5)-glutamine methyltransferase [Roseibacterium sp. KMU-115]|uniref:Release factor glutamine methyltransferase n=1 Tax=Roseicyclus persicicus TaxID=2650661 RepID=A0A7X6GZY8_9RHOB|nr:peptide chain release factor N(5)-glutamine methyltransferase [Roseibacterium persicicum]NKX44854.1 peptide chain release factor N(5)-glutamine methyltransferase [Roseibacterium persicicum]
MAAARAALAPVIGAEAAAREARLMLGHATGWSPAQVAVAGGEALEAGAAARADALLARRMRREPLAQILGDWGFFGRRFAVTRDTLTPRPDTETLVELALAAPFRRVIDLGTGTGAIAVTLLAERPAATGVATDLSVATLAVAEGNAARHGVAGRLSFLNADWWDGVEGVFDLVVSNPPYVTEAEYAGLAPEITGWEPRGALTPGGDGLAAYRAIAAGLGAHLAPGGRCLVEIGAGQGEAVAALFAAAGLDAVAVHPDINGKPRVVSGTMPMRHDPP